MRTAGKRNRCFESIEVPYFEVIVLHQYSTDEERTNIVYSLTLFAVLMGYATSLLLIKTRLEFPWYWGPPDIAFWFGLALVVFDRWLWRARIGPFRFTQIPDFSGYYEGELTANYPDKKRRSDITVRIEQRWLTIGIKGETISTSAKSHMAFVSSEDEELRYEFWDNPHPDKIAVTHSHIGVSFYRKNSKGLTGGYYTYSGPSRDGSIELMRLPRPPKA